MVIITLLQQPIDWSAMISTLGFPIVMALIFGLFIFKVVWPWMISQMENYAGQITRQNDKYQELVQEQNHEARRRDEQYREDSARKEKEYRDLLQQQAQLTIRTLEAINANTGAMQSLSDAVDKLREAAQLEERLADLEQKYRN